MRQVEARSPPHGSQGTCLSIANGCPGRMRGQHFFMCPRSHSHRSPKHTDEVSHQHQFGLRTLGYLFEKRSHIAQTGLEFPILLPHPSQPWTSGSFPVSYLLVLFLHEMSQVGWAPAMPIAVPGTGVAFCASPGKHTSCPSTCPASSPGHTYPFHS